jgi:hypothetical protein
MPVGLVAGVAVGCKFVVDLAARLYRAGRGRELPGWAKQALSAAVALAGVLGAKADLFAGVSSEPTPVGYALSALVLAAAASEVAHPAIETAKAAGRRVAGASNGAQAQSSHGQEG